MTDKQGTLGKFRKKPAFVDAIQFTGSNEYQMHCFCEDRGMGEGTLSFVIVGSTREKFFLIETLEGEMRGNVGDWLIRGIEGEFYPCKPDIFAETYEPAESCEG